MTINAIKEKIIQVLESDERLWNEAKDDLNQTLLLDLVEKIDEKIIGLLLEEESLREKFFVKIKDVYVFKSNDFRFFMEENRVDNSYTQYKNRIGLTDGKNFLSDSGDVVLDFPYKDCVLAGGQSNEEGEDIYFEYTEEQEGYKEKRAKRKETFFNQTLAKDEIDRLFDSKALINWKRYPEDRKKVEKEFQRDENGTIKENLIIKGNNLIALHSIEKAYKGRVKFIYIDPPYNTGTDSFNYNDNFNHSSWLTFMKTRLELARDLLTDDGVIFISVDDYEQAYLKVLMDEIFTEKSFIGTLTWISTTQPDNIGKARFGLQKNIEYILFYSKCAKNDLPPFILKPLKNKRSYPHIHNNKPCRYEIIERAFDGAYARPTMQFEILGQPPRDGKQWQIGLETARQLEKLDKVKIVDGIVKRVMYEEDDLEKGSYKPFWSHLENTGTSQKGKNKLKKIFEGDVTFDTVKPVNVIKHLLSHFDKDAIVLDFFAGSGTTGHAVLDINKEDKGNRKFILIEQMNYINTITCPRIEKVIEKEKIEQSFIYFELAQWNEKAKAEIL